MEFRNKYWFLSNMFPCSVTIGLETGIYTFECAESAFQACKNPYEVEKFLGIDGFEAKRLGRTVNIDVKEWNERRDECMALVVEAKFTQNAELMNKLLNVKGDIIEENTWKDGYWGMYKKLDHVEEQSRQPVYKLYGENKLGKILMSIRDKYLADDKNNDNKNDENKNKSEQ